IIQEFESNIVCSRVRPRLLSVISLCAYAGLFISTYSWPFLPNNVKISVNGSDWGCFSERFDWCYSLKEVSPWLYYIFLRSRLRIRCICNEHRSDDVVL
ncbi:hypothetical protein OESDEN_25030, partial [Oesophagostomum dentatum]